jgi:Zn-dependent protease with chaperone function
LWTALHARRLSNRPVEVWGRHLRFLTRLLNVIWIAWLPVYFLLGVGEVIAFAFSAHPKAVSQIVSVAFYFVPPVVAMLLCHLASLRVYEKVPAVDWSPRDVVRHAILVNILSLLPMFLVVLGISMFGSDPRQAALYAVIGYIAFIVLNHNIARVLGSRLHALTSGPLRDRIFDLAQRAGVVLQQVYVLPETRAQLSNAFARSDNSVMITNSLLKNLSRREVDAIMAHEIGHLQAKHPQTSGKIMLAAIVGANLVGTVITLLLNISHATPLVFSAAVAFAYLIVFFRSRRNEQQADAIGITLTGDPEAFISGLAKLSRLNLMPLHSGGWGESLDTHPGTMRRFEQIAREYGITETRVHELVTDSATPADKYPSIDADEVDTTIFSSEFKKKYRNRVALALLAVLLLAPVPFAILLTRDGLSWPGILAISVAGLVWTFGVMQVARNWVCLWGYDSLSRPLKMKLDRRGLGDVARYGTIVGLAPAGESRKYEGYAFWDIGVLWLTKEKLYYAGEQCDFAVSRDQVNEFYSCDTNPEWFPEKSLYLRWKENPATGTQTLHFVDAGASSIGKARRAIDLLQNRFEGWMYQREDYPVASASLDSIGPPAFPEITSTPAIMKFKPDYVFKAAIQLALYGAVIGFAIRLDYPSIIYMYISGFIYTVVDELPKAFKRERIRQTIPSPGGFAQGSYETGSWMDA